MELLRSHLSRVRIPEPTNRIYKHECCISFDTPRSEGGLFVDMSSFLAFGKDYVAWNYEKTGNPVYLHIQQKKKPVPEDRPLKKPMLLAIGVEGGFDSQDPEYEETHNIVILPDYVSLPFPSVELPEKVRLAVDAVLMAEGAERKEQLAAWTADKKQISAHAMNLQQINNGVVVPPSGWKCCKCEKTENLWLNLTDGMIFCGRRNWDGSGGNNHAIEHYEETKYPLAVKLGTITADLEAADVFSYPEDDSVEDPLLAQHLAFFGIDFSSLRKTEMTTAERELDHNTNFDWNRIQESGQEVEPLFGPGYTGLVNLGNSCYMASIMQVVFSTRSFISRYFDRQSLRSAFEMAPADPTIDLNTQLTKLGHGLLSGKYSFPAEESDELGNSNKTKSSAKQEGIPPRMFKTVIAASHPEFSSTRQQDALEFFLHLLDQVEQVNAGKPEFDPSRSFKFFIEERLQCPSGKVAYNKRTDYILSLNIPLHEATNKEQVEAFNELKAEKKFEGKEVSSDEIVRPRVPLEACLASFSAPEEVHEFYSTALNSKTTAIKTAGLTTFPDYLVLHMRKFVMEEGWVPKKLDVYIDVPDVIDISHMRSKGVQPGEELLPETASGGEKLEPYIVVASEDIVSKLAGMGFNYLHCQKAAINTANVGVEEAMTWLLSHMDDPDIDDPISHESRTTEPFPIDEASVETLVSFGFQEDVVRKALKASNELIKPAIEGTLNVLKSCVKAKTVKRVILTSSAATISANKLQGSGYVMTEESWSDTEFLTTDKPPSWGYLVSKTLAEKEAWRFAEQNKIELVSIIPPLMLGPALSGGTPSSLAMGLSLLTGDEARVGGLKIMQVLSGSISFAHVEDVSRAEIFVAETESASGRYICCAANTSLPELAEFLSKRYPQYKIPTNFSDVSRKARLSLSSDKLVKAGFKFEKKELETIYDSTVEYAKTAGLLTK